MRLNMHISIEMSISGEGLTNNVDSTVTHMAVSAERFVHSTAGASGRLTWGSAKNDDTPTLLTTCSHSLPLVFTLSVKPLIASACFCGSCFAVEDLVCAQNFGNSFLDACPLRRRWSGQVVFRIRRRNWVMLYQLQDQLDRIFGKAQSTQS